MDRSRKSIEPNGSNCFSSVSIPDFLRKPIATFDFPSLGLGLEPLSPALDLPMQILHILFSNTLI